MLKSIFLIQLIVACILLNSFDVLAEKISDTKVHKAYLGQAAELQTWGILSCESETAYVLSSGTYETLIYWDGQKYQPSLAKSWKILSPLEIEFELGEHYFSNGLRLTATHFAESLKAFNDFAVFGKLMLSNIKEVEVINERRLIVRLKQHDSLAMRRLAYQLRVFPCPEYCAKDLITSLQTPGTGPLKLTEYKSGVLKFKFWKNKKPSDLVVYTGKMPDINFIKANKEIGFISDLSHRLNLIVSKDFDLKIVNEPMFSSSYGVFNTLKKKCTYCNPNLREAVNIALNRKEINRLVFSDSAIILKSLGLKGETGSATNLPSVPYDVERAKIIVKEYKKSNNIKVLKLIVGAQSPVAHDLAILKVIKGQLQKVGIDLELNDSYDVSKNSEFLQDIDMVWGTDPSLYNHTDFLFNNFFAEKSPFYLIRDEQLNDLYKRAINADSEMQSTLIFEEIDRNIRKLNYVVVGFQLRRNSAVNSTLYNALMRATFHNLSVIYGVINE